MNFLRKLKKQGKIKSLEISKELSSVYIEKSRESMNASKLLLDNPTKEQFFGIYDVKKPSFIKQLYNTFF